MSVSFGSERKHSMNARQQKPRKNVASPAQSARTDCSMLRSLLHKRQTCASSYTQSPNLGESVKVQILLHEILCLG